MPTLSPEGFRKINPRDQHVTGALDQLELAEGIEVAQRALDTPAVDALVEELDLSLSAGIVVDDHLLTADHRGPAHLAGVEPADVNVDGDPVLVFLLVLGPPRFPHLVPPQPMPNPLFFHPALRP